ncbi:MAG: malonyl-ACP O-methyltransferase BioC [Gammaproteobacteria bacterium]|nr:malonyl-ACP O-methyltransferase BioC [Gammaproteobacteria bacterium]
MDLLNPPRLDKRIVKKCFNRAANSYDNVAILQEEILKRLLQRLQYMRHQPETIIDIGCATGMGIRGLQKQYPRAQVHACDIAFAMLLQARSRYRFLAKRRLVNADMEQLPFAAQSFDLVFSSLALHWSNDLRATLAEFARISRSGALLLFSSFGPATLQELAYSWQALDNDPHVHQFIDMHDVGDAMLATGFAQPVVDAEIIRMEYRDFPALLADLKNIGATNADVSRRRGLMTPRQLRRLEHSYREHGFEDGKFIASYEVIYGHAWGDQVTAQEPGGNTP